MSEGWKGLGLFNRIDEYADGVCHSAEFLDVRRRWRQFALEYLPVASCRCRINTADLLANRLMLRLAEQDDSPSGECVLFHLGRSIAHRGCRAQSKIFFLRICYIAKCEGLIHL